MGTPSFEDNLQQITAIIKKMESGQLTLDETIKDYRQALALIDACQKALARTEEEVKKIEADYPPVAGTSPRPKG